MPRVEMFDRAEVLEKALDLFWTKGYEATSLSDLTQELGIGKGSFYNAFGNKRKLFDTCLSTYRAKGYDIIDELLKDKSDPTSGIRNFLKFHAEIMLNDTHGKGCMIANSTIELSHDKEIQAILREHNQILKEKFMDYLKDGPFAENSATMADTLVIHATGISVLSKFIKDPKRFQESNEQLFKSLTS